MRKIKLTLAALLLLPFAANAVPVKYVVTGTSESGWDLTGQVVLDSSDLIAGDNLVGAFIDWAFSWTNGTDTLVADPGSSFLDPDENFFAILADLSVGAVELCPGECSGAGGSTTWPDIIISGDSVEGYFWDASITPREPFGCCVTGGSDDEEFATAAEWSGPLAVTVPEPGTLALLGAGLVGIGLARRRRKA